MPSATDVITGDPAAVASTARTLTSIADDVARHAARLRSLASSGSSSSGSSWAGTAATRAHARTVTLPPKLDKVTTSYGAAGSALLRYAGALADTTERSRAAVSAFTRADDELRSAQAAQAAAASSDDAAVAAAAAAGVPAPPPTAPRYQASIDAAAAARTRAAATNAQAHADLARAASVAAAALKQASHQGIRNKSWWQHVTHTAVHWLSAQWHDALSHLADIGGKISVIAGIAAAVLAVGGLLFPPLEAAAAAAEGIAAVSGVLSAGSAAADDLTTPGHQREGLVALGMAALPGPASKILRRLPVGLSGRVLTAVEEPMPRSAPLGFRDATQYEKFKTTLNRGLQQTRYPNTVPIMQGSSVTGVKYTTGEPFDVGRTSDFDIALAGPEIFAAARRIGVKTRGNGVRTAPLPYKAIARLGLHDMRRELARQAGRKVEFMVYRSVEDAMADKPSIRMLLP